jgi:hypothetical protein
MNLSEIHDEIHRELKKESRALRKLSEQQVTELINALQTNSNDRDLALFIILHSTHSIRDFEPSLLRLLNEDLAVRETIFLLNAIRLHVVEARFKEGERLTHEFLEAIKLKLNHPDPSVKEWTLRLIDQCGPQNIVFRSEVSKIRPMPWSLWRAHNRTILELIVFLERQWMTREKS